MGISKDEDMNSQNTDFVAPVDASMKQKFGGAGNAYEVGFSAASGVRNETFESSGAVKHPESKDHARPAKRLPPELEEENPGLADN